MCSSKRVVCAFRGSSSTTPVLALTRALFCWGVVTVKDEEVAKVSHLSPTCHKSLNAAHKDTKEIQTATYGYIRSVPHYFLFLIEVSNISIACKSMCVTIWETKSQGRFNFLIATTASESLPQSLLVLRSHMLPMNREALVFHKF